MKMEGDVLVLKIYRAPSGQWAGKLMEGEFEHAGIAGCASAEEVEEEAEIQGIFPDCVEITR